MRTIVCLLIAPLTVGSGWAYEEPLHKKMTRRAFDLALASNDFLTAIGIVDGSARTEAEEQCALGAEQEDGRPRPVNHFFDPVNGVPLMVTTLGGAVRCFPIGLRADVFALRDVPAVLPPGLNSHRLSQIQEHYYQGLAAASAADRRENGRQLFVSLGHLMHLVQDMAQPEHTRNDQHLIVPWPPWPRALPPLPQPWRSRWEHWTLRTLAPPATPLGSVLGDMSPTEPFFRGYPLVKLPNYEDYFHEGSTPAGGRGLADYSSRNFVTDDTNYDDDRNPSRCEHYALPRLADAVPRSVTTTERVASVFSPDAPAAGPECPCPSGRLLPPTGLVCECDVQQRVYMSHPTDTYEGATARTATDSNHTVLSALDFETRRYDPDHHVYSLDDHAYASRAELLIPRAVGYSAGILDHFFRGKIDAAWHEDPDGSASVDVTNLSSEMISNAHIEVYLRREGGDELVRVATANPVERIYPHEDPPTVLSTVHVEDIRSGDPDRCASSFERRIVIRGTLGSEENAVIGLIQPAGPVGACPGRPPDPGCVDGVGCGVAGRLRIELETDTPYDVGLQVDDVMDHNECTESGAWTTSSSVCFNCGPGTAGISGSSVAAPAAPGALESISVDVPAAVRNYHIFTFYDPYHIPPTNVTVRAYVNDRLVWQRTRLIKSNFTHTCPECKWGGYPRDCSP
jgi:hypothetical protein